MFQSLWIWILEELTTYSRHGEPIFLMPKALEAQRILRVSNTVFHNHSFMDQCHSFQMAFQNQNETIYLLDFLVRDAAAEKRHELNDILHQSGSIWTIGSFHEHSCLIRRVSGEMFETYERALHDIENQKHLQQAMKRAYGVNPNPSAAYAEAIKAIESVVCPLVTPKDSVSTLGKVISVLKDQSWDFSANAKNEDSESVVVKLMDIVWRGQTDRHGSAKSSQGITQEQAEFAFSAALFLIENFQKGRIRRRAQEGFNITETE